MNTSNHKNLARIILAGIDLGPLSEQILHAAASLAPRGSGRELHIVHVMPSPPPRGLGETRGSREMELTMDMESVQLYLNQLGHLISDSVERLVAHIRVGSPDIEIAQLASDLRAETIVVGTRGKEGLERLLLGSVAESLVRRAPCAVLTYRPRVEAPWEEILPPCADCVAVQERTHLARLWCHRHAQHRARPHTYYEIPSGYGIGAQTLRAV